MLLSDYISEVRSLVHDLQTQDWSDAELTTIINNARQRVALDLHCVRQFYTGLNLIPNQEVYPITGGVGDVLLTNGGTGYPAAPTVTIAAPTSGVQATATAVAVGGVIQSVTMTNWGSGYTSVPAVSFGGGGVNAVGTAVALLSVLDILSISILWPGQQQRYTMSWMPFTPFQAFCRANPTGFSNPAAWTTHDQTNQVFYYPIPNQTYGAEIDAVVLPANLLLTTDNDTQVIQPSADCVQYYAAHLALLKLQNFEQADYMRKLYKSRCMEIQNTRQDRRVGNVYRNWFRRMNRW